VQARPTELGARVMLTPQRRLAVQAREDSQSSRDETVLRAVPPRDRELRFALQEFRERAWIEAGFGAREAFADVGFATLRYYERWSRRWSTLFSMSRNERTIDSSALAVAGMRDELSLRGLYSFSKTEFVGAQLWRAGYRSQHGVSLGSATGYQLDAGHRLRIEYPDVTLRVLAGQLHTRTAGGGDPATATLNPAGEIPGPGFFVPGGSARYGIGVALGEGAREAFTRALRAYGGVDLTHNSLTGAGYNAWVGLRASVFGFDQLRLYAARGRSAGLSNEAYLEYGIRYEYHFDRL
jgi:polysaccharide biosynthesis protein PelB